MTFGLPKPSFNGTAYQQTHVMTSVGNVDEFVHRSTSDADGGFVEIITDTNASKAYAYNSGGTKYPLEGPTVSGTNHVFYASASKKVPVPLGVNTSYY